MKINNQDLLASYQELALGSRLKRLSDQLMKETSVVYKAIAIDFDPYHMPIFKLINEQNDLTISGMSSILGVTQPAVTQYVNTLIKKKLIISKIDSIDKRKRKVELTSEGKKLIIRLEPIWLVVINEAKKITQVESNKTLLDHISFIENALKEKSFSQRILENL